MLGAFQGCDHTLTCTANIHAITPGVGGRAKKFTLTIKVEPTTPLPGELEKGYARIWDQKVFSTSIHTNMFENDMWKITKPIQEDIKIQIGSLSLEALKQAIRILLHECLYHKELVPVSHVSL